MKRQIIIEGDDSVMEEVSKEIFKIILNKDIKYTERNI